MHCSLINNCDHRQISLDLNCSHKGEAIIRKSAPEFWVKHLSEEL